MKSFSTGCFGVDRRGDSFYRMTAPHLLFLCIGSSILMTSSGEVGLLAPAADPGPQSSSSVQVNDVKLGDLYLQVLSTQDLVGYNASLPYIRKGDIQWQAIRHIFTVENEVDHFTFLMKVQHSLVVYNISAEISPFSTAINPRLYFATTETSSTTENIPLTPLTGNLGYNQENKTRKVDVVALCDASEQIIHNATLIIKINFQFRLLSSSTNNPSVKSGQSSLQPFMKVVMQPTVPITVLRHKKCYLSNDMGVGGYKPGGGHHNSNRTSTMGSNAGDGNGGAAAWGIFASTSSSSIFFVSIGISLGVIVIICIVVAFYHITTFRPQQRRNRCYSELPFTDPRGGVVGVGGTGVPGAAGGQGHVPMFMPKNSNSNAMQVMNNPSHMQRGGGFQCLDSNALFMLNQSKISDGSDQSQTQRVTNQSPANSVYHQPVQQKSPATPFLSPAASNSLCTAQQSQPPAPPSAVYNSYSGQASCYPGQQGAGGSTSTPVDMRGAMYNQREMNTAPDLAHLIAAVNGGNNSNQQPQDIVINRDVVSFQNIIQEGTFGKLCHGFVTLQKRDSTNKMDQQQQQTSGLPSTMEVFIKTVSLTSSVGQVELMLAEGFKYRNISNKYILSLAAVVPPTFSTTPTPTANTSQQLSAPPMLIYPYSANGNLKLFLKNLRESHQPLTTRDVVGMALQIGKAVQYLDKRKVAVGDLATRNCVVDERLCVKITDSALARDIFPNDYNCLGDERNRPVKWLSPESLAFYLTEAPGDIWSFGVTIWELLTLAQQPYLETDPFEMLAFLKKGSRLYQPLNCPDELYRLMESCWCYDSEERPKINKLITYLVDFNKTLGAYI